MVSRVGSDIAAHGSADRGQGSRPRSQRTVCRRSDQIVLTFGNIRNARPLIKRPVVQEAARRCNACAFHRLGYDRGFTIGRRGVMAPRLRFFAVLLLLALAGFPQSSAYAQSDLARAYRVIASKQFVDLTHSFGPNPPVWSGFGQAKMTPAADPKTHKPYSIKDDGFRATFYEMVGQYGTHVDPPAHFDEQGITMDEIPLK